MAQITKRTTKDGDTRWRMRVFVGRHPDTGKRRFISQTFDRKKDAEAEARRLERQRDQGALVAPVKEPTSTYLRRWLRDVMRGRVRARTWKDYSGILRRYVEEPPSDAPTVGGIRLDRLRPEAIQALYGWLQAERGLSPATVRTLHAVVRQGLAYAVRTGAIARNPADLVVLPKRKRRKVEAMTTEEANRFLNAAREDRYYGLWCILATGGLRPSEALALKWSDVDTAGGKIHVERSLTRRGVEGWELVAPKTSQARRVVVLPDFAIEAVREWKPVQARERLLLGAEYEDHGFVFTSEFGRPLDVSNLSDRNFRRIMEAAGVGEYGPEPEKPPRGPRPKRPFHPAYRMYDLRHTAATLLLRAGENPKVVSERLGHASVAFTMDVYAASLPDLQEEAANKMQAMLGPGAREHGRESTHG